MSTSLGTGGFRYLFDANKDAQLENASDTFQLSSDAFEEACTFLREDTLGQEAFVATPFGKIMFLLDDRVVGVRVSAEKMM